MESTEKNQYNVGKYRTPDGAPADIVIFTITRKEKQTAKKSLPYRDLMVLLIRRKRWPFAGSWALPGGFGKESEALYDTARRELMEETGVADVHLDYLNVYSRPGRDPRGWMISHAFYALVNEKWLEKRKAADAAEDVKLFTVDEALNQLELAFDHHEIIADAYQKIQQEMLVTTIAKEFLPEMFTLSELYQVIQTVVPEFKETNFIRKITSTQSRRGIIQAACDEHGEKLYSNQYSQRPAQLYRFTDYVPTVSIYT